MGILHVSGRTAVLEQVFCSPLPVPHSPIHSDFLFNRFKTKTRRRTLIPGGLATPTLCHSNERNISGPFQGCAFAASR
jgi:hypothetical protein